LIGEGDKLIDGEVLGLNTPGIETGTLLLSLDVLNILQGEREREREREGEGERERERERGRT
jgi:hypothetical protein